MAPPETGDFTPDLVASGTQDPAAVIPDILELLADSRQQLDAALETIRVTDGRALTAERSEAALRKVVDILRPDAARLASEVRAQQTGLADALAVRDEQGRQLFQAAEDLARIDELLRHQAEATRQAEELRHSVEAQLQEIWASRSWRLAEPLRRLGALRARRSQAP